jgi:Arylamine N-acetyltransferase
MEKYEGCDIKKYLERIGYKGEAKVDLDTLKALNSCHVKTVPYENLDILAKKDLRLDIPSLYDKVVVRRRGGYCFEVNGLFAWLLQEIGFEVVQHFGRWMRGEPLEAPMRRHRSIRVTLNGEQYICDVGAGLPSPQEPLRLEFDTVQTIKGEDYRIIKDPVHIYLVQYMSSAGTWKNQFSFNDDPCIPIDYYQPHYYCTTHPDSPFLNYTMVYVCTDDGRHTIADVYDQYTGLKAKELRTYSSDGLKKTLIRNDEQFNEILSNVFGLK